MSRLAKLPIIVAAILPAFALPAAGEKPVWLVANGFHSSLVVRTRDVPGWRKLADGRTALLIGWGDVAFYRGERSVWAVIKALCWPTPGVLHVVPVQGTVARRFAHSDVVRFTFSDREFAALCRDLEASFARDRRGRRIVVGAGYFADSRFYAGTESFYFPKMCNLWTAEKLKRRGIPLCLPQTIAASELVWQAARSGRRERWRQRPVDAF